jgi:predicted TIM-barrel fold metal-dependent hydrolase
MEKIMIIDAHAHLGWDCVFDEDFSKEEQITKHNNLSISKTILQPATCHDIETVRKQHDDIAAFANEYPGQFFGMANPNPHLSDDIYEAELLRCIKELHFVGIKLHSFAHAVNPCSKDGKKVFKLASRLGVPVMIHTGSGIPFANPCNLIPIAEEFPEVKIIMAHCGQMVLAGEVPTVMKQCSNIYADVSWTGGFLVKHWVESFGAHRFMFGSDHADNACTELVKIKSSGIHEDELEWLLHKTAESVFLI